MSSTVRQTLIGAAAGTALALATSPAAGADARIPYPDGYRGWHHVKSMVIEPGHPLERPFAGIHHVYADDAALEGLRTGRYRDGATLVFDLLEARRGDHAVVEGRRKLLGVMVRDASARATGGWRFEAFAGSSRTERLVTDGGAGCFACHRKAADRSYVFSRWRD